MADIARYIKCALSGDCLTSIAAPHRAQGKKPDMIPRVRIASRNSPRLQRTADYMIGYRPQLKRKFKESGSRCGSSHQIPNIENDTSISPLCSFCIYRLYNRLLHMYTLRYFLIFSLHVSHMIRDFGDSGRGLYYQTYNGSSGQLPRGLSFCPTLKIFDVTVRVWKKDATHPTYP